MRLSRERKNNCSVIFAEFPNQLLIVTDDEDRLILKEHVPEKCPDTILSLFNHLKKLLPIPCIIPVDVNARTFEKEKLIRIAESYLQAFRNKVEMPTEELPVIIPPFLIGQQLESDLSGERVGTKTSLLTGKEGQKVFSEKVTFLLFTSLSLNGAPVPTVIA